MNQKLKQSKQPSKGSPYEESISSEKKPKKQELTSLDDLPAFGQKNNARYDFGGFDGFDEPDSSGQNKFSQVEKILDDCDKEEQDGFKVEVKRPAKSKAQPVSSGKKRNHGKFNKNLGGNGTAEDHLDDELIEEDIPTDRENIQTQQDNVISSLGHQAGITVSQSLGIDPSVDSLALDEYDHIEVVEV